MQSEKENQVLTNTKKSNYILKKSRGQRRKKSQEKLENILRQMRKKHNIQKLMIQQELR